MTSDVSTSHHAAVNFDVDDAAADNRPSPSMTCCVRLALTNPFAQISSPPPILVSVVQAHTHAEPSAPVLRRQASSREASTSESGQAAESGSTALEPPSPAANLADLLRRMGWTQPADPQQVSDEQQMVQAAEGIDKVADGSEVQLRVFRMFSPGKIPGVDPLHLFGRHEEV